MTGIVKEFFNPERVKKLRKGLSEKRGHTVSQEEMGRECGVSAYTVGGWERGRMNPGLYTAVMNLLRLEREVAR